MPKQCNITLGSEVNPMGFMLKMKLMMMPVMDFNQMTRGALSSAGCSSDQVDKWLANRGDEMSKYLLREFNSADAADTYATHKSQVFYGDMGMLCAWKRVGSYLCFFISNAGMAAIGYQTAPSEYIVRTGESVWKAYEVPKILQDHWHQQQLNGG